MIHELKEEIYISLYLIIYGIYIISSYDIILYILNKLKINKILHIILELIYFIIQLILTYFFSYKLASGYMPIYFILFIVIGLIIYYKLLRKSLINNLEVIFNCIKLILPTLKKVVQNLIYSKELISLIRGIIKKTTKKIRIIKRKRNDEVKALES